MKKKLLTVLSATALSLSMCIPAFAGQWVSNSTGWWWQNDDGSWPANSWQWLDGNKDGVLWSSFFVTLVAKKIVLINLCCRPCCILRSSAVAILF